MFEFLKDLYDKQWCRKDQLKQFVAFGDITPEEYEEITGEGYEE